MISSVLFSQQLVMRGDHPDPSVVKIGDTYWASATTSNWLPAYPLLYSKDLVNWSGKGYAFTEKPDWADFYFWAPEISYDNGKVYIYYAAHKKNGNLCLSVASADKPEGPYKDHGPLMCEAAGSIDAFPMRDEQGKLFMIWKEDGNSVKQPTPIWIQEMNEERTALIGDKKELFRNSLDWEGNLVEGVSMMKIGEYYYAFYAAAGCCGAGCNYQSGIARSKNLQGPWEKYAKNPVLKDSEKWKCPGHGTPIEKDGRFYFLYHAYDKESNIFTGRQGLLQEFRLTNDKWIEFISSDETMSGIPRAPSFSDPFDEKKLNERWQWSVFQSPSVVLSDGNLSLKADSQYLSGSYLGTKVLSRDYEAVAAIDPRTTAAAGIGAIGDDKNTISLLSDKGKLKIVIQREGKETQLLATTLPRAKTLHLKMSVRDNSNFSFSYSVNGKNFILLNKKPVDGTYLPPWDRALRIGLISKGSPDKVAVFREFRLDNKPGAN
ncbi:family 43 glycosylhydrolase [Flavitalea antarctica]